MASLRNFALTGTAIAICLSATACVPTAIVSPSSRSGSYIDKTLGTVSIASYQKVSAVLNFTDATARLPLSAVSLQTNKIAALTQHAIAILTDRCMAEAGFAELSSSVEWNWNGEENRTFGMWDVAAAKKYGFLPNPTRAIPTVDTGSQTPAYLATLPNCAEKALAPIRDDLVFLQDTRNIDYEIYSAAYDATLASADGRAALAERAACLHKNRIEVDPRTYGPVDGYLRQSQIVQIHAATIYAQCSIKTGTIRVLFDIDAKYQAAYMAKNASAIAKLNVRRIEIEKKMTTIVDGALV